jgi:phosphatidate cytidylyltransferase
MSKNLIKRVITSIILLSILLISIFSNNIIFILSLFILSSLICFEANNIFDKIINNDVYKINKKKEFNSKFLFLNILTIFICFYNIFSIIISNSSNRRTNFFSFSNIHMFFFRYRRLFCWEVNWGKKII